MSAAVVEGLENKLPIKSCSEERVFRACSVDDKKFLSGELQADADDDMLEFFNENNFSVSLQCSRPESLTGSFLSFMRC